ncbi:paraquat-inducible protein A [Qingshengfaniella alkalisoli]|uniref:paraquat-inducible protein A n=1 Tax=Qingshengfaniella alkalisoli TaxID=2599296 RepID=UPI00143D9922|nr:paraquat-inducible protein A [Qingshengfaniella alkalisoli]
MSNEATQEAPLRQIACPQCDALHDWPDLQFGATARCSRCHTVLLAPRENSLRNLVSLTLAAVILMIMSISLPFLSISAAGITVSSSILDAVMAFSHNAMAPLSGIVGILIVILPALRLYSLLYALVPALLGRPLLPRAKMHLRNAMRFRKWAMAEIFLVGVAVALVKIAGLASVSFGPAFWALAGFALLIAAEDILVCEPSLWQRIIRQQPS